MSLDTERSSEVERQRRELLRELDADNEAGWMDRFKPGSFGCHELLDRTNLLVNMIEDNLLSHPSCALNPEWYALADQAVDALRNLYQRIGGEHA